MRYETGAIVFWSEAPDGDERLVLINVEGEFEPGEPERWAWDPQHYDPGSGPERLSEQVSVCYSGDERGPWLDEERDFLRRFVPHLDARLDREIDDAMFEAEYRAEDDDE